MPYWENNDGTFDYSLLFTDGGATDAAVDNPKDKRTATGTGGGKEGATPTSSTGATETNRTTRTERWRGSGHSQR